MHIYHHRQWTFYCLVCVLCEIYLHYLNLEMLLGRDFVVSRVLNVKLFGVRQTIVAFWGDDRFIGSLDFFVVGF